MIKLNGLKEALTYLKASEHVYTEDNAMVIRKGDMYVIVKKGTRFKLSEDDLISLYSDTEFYYDDKKDVFIDILKDEEYYRFKHK